MKTGCDNMSFADITKIILLLLFETVSVAWSVLTAAYIVGLWFMFKKSGIPGWWALFPWARDYMLAK